MLSKLRASLARLRRQRGVRKLLRDRMALASIAVIAAYLVFAVLVGVFGLVSRAETFERVGPDNLPASFVPLDLEERLERAEFLVEHVAEALDSEDPAAALQRIRLAELEPAALPLDRLEPLVAAARATYDRLATVYDLEEDPTSAELVARLEEQAAALYAAPAGLDGLQYRARLLLGTDRQGRSILVRGLYSIKVSILIGAVSALLAVVIGSLLGGLAGYFGGLVDGAVVWLYSTFSSIPWIVLLMVLAAMFMGSRFDGTLLPVYAAFGVSFWISPCRVIRGEVLKLKELEYVQAAQIAGFGRLRILLRHVIPNTAHLMFINFSLLFIGAIKAEVILSFLNLGVKNEPSWGVMINQARQEVLNGFFWQIGTATFLMVVLVLAFNVLSDALQDAFDPKHV